MTEKEKIILYGAGNMAAMFFDCDDWKEYYQVVSVVDSDESKHGKMLGGIEIVSLSDALKYEWDGIVISVKGNAYNEIRNILDRAGIPAKKILSFFQVYHCTKFRYDKSGPDKKKTGLVIIFNHRYEQNLLKLRRIYGNSFSEIRFLMPFYLGEDQDVIPVYDTSYCFHGFVTQAYARLMEMNVEYFLFIADDLIINPEIDEWNAAEKLGLLKEKEIFLNGLSELNRRGSFHWVHMKWSSQPFTTRGMAWRNELPHKEKAFALFKEFMGKEYPREYDDEIFQGCDCFKEDRELFFKSNGNTKEVPYPMAQGYADIFAVKKTSLGKIAHMFGIFASMNMFVEIAVPTAIVLTFKRCNVSFFECSEFLHSMILWTENDKLNIEREYENDINNLLNRFPAECLCIHPVKLSRWVI